jgi:preprotein translocase subunit SecF
MKNETEHGKDAQLSDEVIGEQPGVSMATVIGLAVIFALVGFIFFVVLHFRAKGAA